jgi:hypothetical protein
MSSEAEPAPSSFFYVHFLDGRRTLLDLAADAQPDARALTAALLRKHPKPEQLMSSAAEVTAAQANAAPKADSRFAKIHAHGRNNTQRLNAVLLYSLFGAPASSDFTGAGWALFKKGRANPLLPDDAVTATDALFALPEFTIRTEVHDGIVAAADDFGRAAAVQDAALDAKRKRRREERGAQSSKQESAPVDVLTLTVTQLRAQYAAKAATQAELQRLPKATGALRAAVRKHGWAAVRPQLIAAMEAIMRQFAHLARERAARPASPPPTPSECISMLEEAVSLSWETPGAEFLQGALAPKRMAKAVLDAVAANEKRKKEGRCLRRRSHKRQKTCATDNITRRPCV